MKNNLIGLVLFALVAAAFLTACGSPGNSPNSTISNAPLKNPANTESAKVETKDPLERLIEGNKRFVGGTSIHPDLEAMRRSGLKKGQNPFAVILSCSDSRVPPEIVFDQGLGDLFVVRVAGNIFDDAVDGSIEYAVEHLGAELIVVMGHETCGAVKAAVENNQEAHIKTLAQAIQPAIVEALKLPGDKVDNSVRANARFVVNQIKQNEPILSKKVAEKKVRVVAAYYDLDNGEVTFEQDDRVQAQKK